MYIVLLSGGSGEVYCTKRGSVETIKGAVAVMLRLAEESGDQKLYRCLEQYRSICPQEFETGWTEPKKVHRMTKKLAGMMRRTCHSKTVDLLAQEIREATEIYPKRVFSGTEGDYYRKVMQAVRQRKEELAAQQMDVVVFGRNRL